jgi:predicted transcriptional regulator
MTSESPTEPITVRAAKATIAEIDALAATMDRSRNYVINQALRQYIDLNARDIERIKEGIADARAGHVYDADEVHAAIRAKHGWDR